mmetsp:Transcript_60317/g.90900  ORF Transcript_60317/g.90900 Transcript_60317/m.90900 type:complete len:439 (-) Transcript_60317:44-1360(-)
MSDFMITLCNVETGQSESIPVGPSVALSEVMEFAKALLGMEGNNLQLLKDGRTFASHSLTLEQAGIVNGDLIVVNKPRPVAPPAPAPSAASGGLDFSSLLSSVGSAAAAAPQNAGNNNNNNPSPLYYAGMTLADAVESNPHPKAMVQLLQTHDNLFKELNYHNPVLARKLQNQPYERAVEVWREHMVKSSISSSFNLTQSRAKEHDFQRRLQQNPNDAQAKEYFAKKDRQQKVNQQYQQAMQEYPESMGRVLMLYIEAKINDKPLQAFVDSGAQATIMSKKCAQKCGIFDLVDTRFAGVAVGVGTGKILGRIHMAQLQIGHVHFPCSVTVMDDMTLPSAGPTNSEDAAEAAKPKDMDFLLGLDMLKRHTCCIDLEQGKLKFRLAPGQYLETPFLHEKDLDQSKGGTKGFNADKANEELMEAQRKYDEDNNSGDKMEDD